MPNKGNILDLPILLITLFILAITISTGYMVLKNFDASLTAQGHEIQDLKSVNEQYTLFDSAFIVLLVGTSLGVVVSAYFVETHPVFQYELWRQSYWLSWFPHSPRG